METLSKSRFRINLEKQESLVKLSILTIAAILCEYKFNIKCATC